jgi:hypothetical protein
MSTGHLILDLGSRGAKLYSKAGNIELLSTISWELIDRKDQGSGVVQDTLSKLLKPFSRKPIRIDAVGTEAMRRDNKLERSVSEACGRLGISYRTITQLEEAQLIRKAAYAEGLSSDVDLINVGGGSVQIFLAGEKFPYLLNFGIADLNKRFSLLEAPDRRKVGACIDWIYSKLPIGLDLFAYTGNERSYLLHQGILLEKNGECSRSSFLKMAQEMAKLETKALEARSPFDPAWMRGAVASNCFVLAALEVSGRDYFIPTDFNISHGLIGTV